MYSSTLKKSAALIIVFIVLTGCGTVTRLTGKLPLPFLTQAAPQDSAQQQTSLPEQQAPKGTTAPLVVIQSPGTATPETGQGGASSANPAGAYPVQDAYIDIFSRVNPSVVNIQVVLKATGNQAQPQFNLPNGHPTPDPNSQVPEQALATGFVYSQDGYIVTNNHVVEGTDKIVVTFADGTQAAAKLIGTDPDSDLAVIQVSVDPSMLKPVKLGNSDELKVGQIVVAIGNPYGLQNSMSTGIVSGLGRMLSASGTQSYSIPDMIQTDAAINPGNSGGPLLNLAGEVIGVNTAIESPVRANSGVGYAVPSAIVQQVIPTLIKDGKVQHPWLGIAGVSLNADIARAMSLDPNQHGVLIESVVTGGPAEKAGLHGSNARTTIDGIEIEVGGDVIVAIQGQPVKVFDDLLGYVVQHTKVGDTVTLKILRDGKPEDMQLMMGPRPVASP
jgi:serine protease Do